MNKDNQVTKPIKKPNIELNPLIDGFDIPAGECPFLLGKEYSQDELRALFTAKHGSDIIHWIDENKGKSARNPLAKKYAHLFTINGKGVNKRYLFKGE